MEFDQEPDDEKPPDLNPIEDFKKTFLFCLKCLAYCLFVFMWIFLPVKVSMWATLWCFALWFLWPGRRTTA